MDLPSDIETLPLRELERLLFRAGTSLQGKNLRRASWREIARSLTRGRARAVLTRLLRAAFTRDDAARVLRIARRSRKVAGGDQISSRRDGQALGARRRGRNKSRR